MDVDQFVNLTGKAKIAVTEGIMAAVKFGMQELHKAFVKNLMGVQHAVGTRSPYPGKLPVTKITGHLSQSVDQKLLTPITGVVYVDLRRANYAGYVHDGTRKMAPRPFAREATNERREAILRRMQNEVSLRLNRL